MSKETGTEPAVGSVAPNTVPPPPSPVTKVTLSLTTELAERLKKEYGDKGRSAAVEASLRQTLKMAPRPLVGQGNRFRRKGVASS